MAGSSSPKLSAADRAARAERDARVAGNQAIEQREKGRRRKRRGRSRLINRTGGGVLPKVTGVPAAAAAAVPVVA